METNNWKEVKVEKPKPKFKPFDEVLGCDGIRSVWHKDIYDHYDETVEYVHECFAGRYKYCLPYEGNEHLVGGICVPEHIKDIG